MPYSKDNLKLVVKSIIGSDQLATLGLPRSVVEAALKLFMDSSKNLGEVEVIRAALNDLRKNGCFNFTPNSVIPVIVDEYSEYANDSVVKILEDHCSDQLIESKD